MLLVHLGCQNWTVAQHKADYPTDFDAIRFSAMFSGERNKDMFDRRVPDVTRISAHGSGTGMSSRSGVPRKLVPLVRLTCHSCVMTVN